MEVFEGKEEENYNVLGSLVALAKNPTFIHEGANYIDLLNHKGFDGIKALVDRGYVDTEKRQVHKGLDEIYYRLNDKGMRVLKKILNITWLEMNATEDDPKRGSNS